MILFFKTQKETVIATEVDHQPQPNELERLCWLYGDATLMTTQELEGFYVGPRREMVTPWSTNAVEMTQNMNLDGILRIEEFFPVASAKAEHDPMLQRMYEGIGQDVFRVEREPQPVKHVENLEEYNEAEGLALSADEITYLHEMERQLGRRLTDSEVFGFAQINSEHCRHKIFGGVVTLRTHQENHVRTSWTNSLVLQRQRGLCRRAGGGAVCSGRPDNGRLLPRERH